jgi:type II secretory pathway pseudopilin PulG
LQPNSSAFTRLELVAVIVVIAVIFVLAWPAFNSGLTKRDMTRTMKNGRELYLAAFAMATDGAAKSDAKLAWPGDYPATSLADYCDKLVQNKYLQTSDLQRILSAPGATCNAAMSGPPATLMLSGRSALKVYKASGADSSDTIFAASSNYIYGTPLDAKAVPFGDAGFVVVRKSGDVGVYKKGQATPAGFESTEKFQTDIGALPGATKGTVIAGDNGTVLANPQ